MEWVEGGTTCVVDVDGGFGMEVASEGRWQTHSDSIDNRKRECESMKEASGVSAREG